MIPCDYCSQLTPPGDLIDHVLYGVTYRYCAICHHNWLTAQVIQSVAVGRCAFCGAWTHQAALSPRANSTGGWDLSCVVCRSPASVMAPRPEPSERTVAPATYPYERGGHTYQLATTGWEQRSPSTGVFCQRVELPPGEQVPCGVTMRWKRSAPEAPFCRGWADRGWRQPTAGYFICDGCWEDAHQP